MAEITITLAGTEYRIGELRLRALRDIHTAALAAQAPEDLQENIRRFYDRTAGIISAALLSDHPEMTVEAVLDLPITHGELIAANNALLEHVGLVPQGFRAETSPPGEPEPGEGSPETRSTGDGSTGA